MLYSICSQKAVQKKVEHPTDEQEKHTTRYGSIYTQTRKINKVKNISSTLARTLETN